MHYRPVHGLARFCRRHNVSILALTVLFSALSARHLPLAYDDDVVRFLPEGDPEVERLREIADRFGSIHVALVGVESEDLFEAENLEYVRTLTKALDAIPEVAHVTSLTEIAVIDNENGTAGRDGAAIHRALVPHTISGSDSEITRIRDGVMGLDYLVGSLVSADATSTRLICQLYVELDGVRVSPKVVAERIREVADGLSQPDDVRLHFGGAPFIAEAAANGSQRDLIRLAPWVCLIIVLLIFVSLGSAKAALLALGSVGIGILWTMGLMGALDQPLTLVSTSLPVILVALGSAYAVHLLVWYLDNPADGVEGMLENVGWPVVIAALTTMAGFASFLVMDLPPMREFGWQMAAGTGICGVVSLFVIPSVLVRWPIQGRQSLRVSKIVDDLLVSLAIRSRGSRVGVLIVGAAIALFFGWNLSGVETRMDTRSFFEVGSEPELAEAFMAKRFGGSVFLQVQITGDIKNPAVLRQIADFQDRVAAVPGVTRVESITNVLGLINEAFGGKRHLAGERKTIAYHGYLAENTDPAVRLLVDPAWESALIQVAIGGFDTGVVRRVTDEIRALADEHLPEAVTVVPRNDVLAAAEYLDAAERMLLLTGARDASVESLLRVLDRADQRVDSAAFVRKATAVIQAEIGEDEMVLLKDGADLAALGALVGADMAAGKFTMESFEARLLPMVDPDELDDSESLRKGVRYVYDILAEDAVDQSVDPLIAATLAHLGDPESAHVRRRVAAIVYDLTGDEWVAPASVVEGGAARSWPISAIVSGYPIVQEAMSRSVHRNQINSLLASLPLVLLILCIVFRSVFAGLVGMIPTALTLLVTFGLMGMMPNRLPLDIGGSMLASIALGVGIDYAIHFLWRYRESSMRDAMRTVGRSILINAAEITAGFVVLAGASIVPMSNFGLLTAETLLVAAVATLILMPAVVEWWEPPRHAEIRGES